MSKTRLYATYAIVFLGFTQPSYTTVDTITSCPRQPVILTKPTTAIVALGFDQECGTLVCYFKNNEIAAVTSITLDELVTAETLPSLFTSNHDNIEVNRNGKYIIDCSEAVAHILDLTNETLHTFSVPETTCTCADIGNNNDAIGILFAQCAEQHIYRTLHTYSINDEQEKAVIALYPHEDPWSIAYHPHNHTVAIGLHDGFMKVASNLLGSPIAAILTQTSGTISSTQYRSDGTQLVGGTNMGFITWWDARTGQEINTIHDNDGGVAIVSYAPNHTCIASGSVGDTCQGHRHSVRIWDIRSNQCVYNFTRKLANMEYSSFETQALSWHPDSTKVAAILNERVALCDLRR